MNLRCSAALFLLCVLAIGCNRFSFRSDLKDLMSTKINTPGGQRLSDSLTMVIYVDSSECTLCRLNNLESYHTFINGAGFDLPIKVIIEPTDSTFQAILDYQLSAKYSKSIIIDSTLSFRRMVPAVLLDKRFHVFLTYDRYPIFIGDPFSNQQMMSLFIKSINGFSS